MSRYYFQLLGDCMLHSIPAIGALVYVLWKQSITKKPHTMKTLITAVAAFALAIGAKADDYTITPVYSKPYWNIIQAYVVKDANTGAIIASWSKPNAGTDLKLV